ncbi:MAG: exodeoxyribonuclease VII small subunit [Planctomycetota bacterium]|nr:MAG: exodeoxyribonuclease VII small subunit [Planctomycetota bacterium]RLS93054.1 MAG: exodeoxyribonuclease VII small subunit [Planctomycetota bacterium]
MAKQIATTSDSAHADVAALSYEGALAQLEKLLEQIEGGTVGLAESLEAHGRAELLLKHCRALLDGAELRVRQTSVALESEAIRATPTN